MFSISYTHRNQLDSEPVAIGDPHEKISLGPILTYSQAQTGLNLCVTLIGLHLLYFYSDRRGLSPALAGLAFFIALVLDAVTDPLAGNISDRARFKSGRRRPFFLAAIPMALFYFLLLSPPQLHRGLFAWFLVTYFLMLTARKFYETAYGALMPELTLDYDERTKVASFRQLFGTAGDISGALLPFLASYLFARGLDFKMTGAVCALVVAGSAMALYFGVREREEFSTKQSSRLYESIVSVMANRPFVILLIATSLSVMAINIPTVLIRFLAKYWYHDDGAAARWLIMYFAGSLVSYPFWFKITVRIEKKQAFVVAMLCNALCSLLFLTVSPDGWIALNGLMFLSGFSAIGIWITQFSASADVIEWDEERTGQRQEGAYGGVTTMAVKISVAITLLLAGLVMTWIGYVPGVGSLPTAAAENLRKVFAIGPASIYLISAMVFMRYPITREAHRAMRERLAARGAAAKSA
jgi:GPH family glycoside/pentoside/hexuronide:cation symporter